jgi:hypothetical protein
VVDSGSDADLRLVIRFLEKWARAGLNRKAVVTVPNPNIFWAAAHFNFRSDMLAND